MQRELLELANNAAELQRIETEKTKLSQAHSEINDRNDDLIESLIEQGITVGKVYVIGNTGIRIKDLMRDYADYAVELVPIEVA